MKLGSLFDGSGGFPLAGTLHGIEPVWASEIEQFPIRVTKNRFPNMKHLGSVTDINGAEIEPVDIITFGSPCQDLSVAGKQAGIHEGQRSSLFFEAIRIIKEMRDHDRAIGRTDHDVRPRFAVWENVPGAFSSNKGHDFQAVLQALCEIEGKDVSVPMPPKGKWNPAGCIVGNGWSLAWRVYDAQFWGVPQRRKRIYLIADFGSERAGEILFKPESVRGDSAEGRETGQGTAADAEGSVGRSDSVRCYALDSLSSNSMKSKNPHSGFHEEQIAKTLDTNPDPTCNQGGNVIVQPAAFMDGQGAKARSIAYCEDGSTPTLKSAPSGGNTVPDVVYATGADLYNGQITGDKVATLGANSGQSANHAGPSVVYPINTMVATRGGKDDGRTTFGVGEPDDPQFTISAAHEHAVCYALDATSSNSMKSRNPHSGFHEGEIAETLRTPCGGDSTKANLVVSYGVDCRNVALDKEKTHTIQAKASLNCTPSVLYDARGNGGGMIAPTITGDHNGHISDYTCVCVERTHDE